MSWCHAHAGEKAWKTQTTINMVMFGLQQAHLAFATAA